MKSSDIIAEMTGAQDKSERSLTKLLQFAHDDPEGYRKWVGNRSVVIDASGFDRTETDTRTTWNGTVVVTAPDGVASRSYSMDIASDSLDGNDDEDNLIRAADLAIQLAGLHDGRFSVEHIDSIRNDLELYIVTSDMVKLRPDGTIN